MSRCPECYRLIREEAGCPRHPDAPALEPEGRGAAAKAWPRLEGLELTSILGEGGFASVFAAQGADGEVAVKIAHGPDDRFPREEAALRRIGPPTAPALLGTGLTDDQRPYLVMERLHGETLSRRLAALPGAGALPDAEALPLLEKLCQAVDLMHERGVIQRDLKPQNVFLCEDGRLALIDFGLARGAGEADQVTGAAPNLTRTGQRMGTVLYMSPEQCQEAREVDARSDLYAVGVMLFEMLCGRPPFVGDLATVLAAHASRRPPRISELGPVPPAADEVMARCLAKEPSARFPDGRSFYEAVERALASSPSPAAPRPARARSSKRRQVALLAVKTALPADALTAELAAEGAQLARVQGDRYLFGFPGEPSPEAGVRTASRAAKRLFERSATDLDVVLHVAELRVRERRGRVALAGAALERPGEWLPTEAQANLRLTEAAAAFAEEAVRARGLFAFDSTQRSEPPRTLTTTEAPLTGREPLLEEALSEARSCFEESCPTLTTLVGEVGHGKSRVIDALRERIARDVRVVRAAARPPSAGDPEAALRTLLTAGLGLAEGAGAGEVEAACRQRLGEEQAEAAWPAVALVLGALGEEDPRVAPILGAPGALRQTLARAAGAGLRGLAREPLAVFVDDAHYADHAALDALEMATLAGGEAPIWICVAAQPALRSMRVLWAERAGRAREHEVGPLSREAMRELALALLRPVEFIPEPVLERLIEMTGGVPVYMVDLARSLANAGAIRRHVGTDEWYIAADEIPHVAAAAPAADLAGHALAALPVQLASLAGLTAVLGQEISVDEVDAVCAALPTEEAPIDPAFGLPRLARAGLLRPVAKDRFAFRHPMMREAVESRVPPPQRRELHRAALEHLGGRAAPSRAARERIARHAAACGEAALAAEAHLGLAEEDSRRHRYIEAESHYTAALEQLQSGDELLRERILGGRGRIRYRLQRFREALEDLEAARRLARDRGDEREVASLLLDEATVLDWSYEWPASERRVEEALPLVERLEDPHLEAAARVARGRTLWRQDRVEEALEVLADAADRARRRGDHESHTIALLLLGPALAASERLAESEARFEEVIRACRERGDSLHLCAAYVNRLTVWIKRQQVERATDDQRRVITLARELGFSFLEAGASHNLAELLHQLGEPDEALPLARRAAELVERLGIPGPDNPLLLARIQCARGAYDDAAERIAWIRDHVPGEQQTALSEALGRLVELQVEDATGRAVSVSDWEELLAQFATCSVLDEQIEALYAAASWARARDHRAEARRWIDRAGELAGDSPIWKSRLADVAAETTNG